MSSKKAVKIEVKSEEMMTGTQDNRGDESDGDRSGNDDEETRSAASAVEKEQSEMKSEVKTEVTKVPAKKRKRGNADDIHNSGDESSNTADVRTKKKKKKPKKRAKTHACTEPRCGKVFTSQANLVILFERTPAGSRLFVPNEVVKKLLPRILS
jgi:hypothetical protein